MKKKKTFPVLLAVAVIVCGVVWLRGAGDNKEEPKIGYSISATWTEYFDSVGEMEAASDIGIVGILSDSNTEVRGNIVFTRNIVEVVEVHSGDVQVGDFVEVLQTGGEHGNKSTPAFSEAPLMEANKQYAMFLKETEPHDEYGQYFLIAGGYLGLAEIPAASSPQAMGETVEFTDYFADNFN